MGKQSFIGIAVLMSLLLVNTVSAEDVATQPATQQEPLATVSNLDDAAKANSEESRKLQANVALHTLTELQRLLEQAEKISNDASSGSQYPIAMPILVVLHGEEINAFVRSNYRDNKGLVDLAARLDAFNVIDVKVCKRWMGANGVAENQLPPFVESVPLGIDERARLEKAGYAYF